MRLIIIFFLVLYLFATSRPVNAASAYVLPYPSVMPGSIFYEIGVLKEIIFKYWYFGDFGQFTYNLKESDKYLVEAKTLFEYEQYLLGLNALYNSDKYFSQTFTYLKKAEKNKKNILEKRNIFKQAGLKHVEVLEKLLISIPEKVDWREENKNSKLLELKKEIENSISARKNNI